MQENNKNLIPKNRSTAFSKQTVRCIRSQDLLCVSEHFVVQRYDSASKIITGLGNTLGVRLSNFPEGYDNYNATKKTETQRGDVHVEGTNTAKSELEEFRKRNKNVDRCFLLPIFLRLFFVHLFFVKGRSIKFMKSNMCVSCTLQKTRKETRKRLKNSRKALKSRRYEEANLEE